MMDRYDNTMPHREIPSAPLVAGGWRAPKSYHGVCRMAVSPALASRTARGASLAAQDLLPLLLLHGCHMVHLQPQAIEHDQPCLLILVTESHALGVAPPQKGLAVSACWQFAVDPVHHPLACLLMGPRLGVADTIGLLVCHPLHAPEEIASAGLRGISGSSGARVGGSSTAPPHPGPSDWRPVTRALWGQGFISRNGVEREADWPGGATAGRGLRPRSGWALGVAAFAGHAVLLVHESLALLHPVVGTGLDTFRFGGLRGVRLQILEGRLHPSDQPSSLLLAQHILLFGRDPVLHPPPAAHSPKGPYGVFRISGCGGAGRNDSNLGPRGREVVLQGPCQEVVAEWDVGGPTGHGPHALLQGVDAGVDLSPLLAALGGVMGTVLLPFAASTIDEGQLAHNHVLAHEEDVRDAVGPAGGGVDGGALRCPAGLGLLEHAEQLLRRLWGGLHDAVHLDPPIAHVYKGHFVTVWGQEVPATAPCNLQDADNHGGGLAGAGAFGTLPWCAWGADRREQVPAGGLLQSGHGEGFATAGLAVHQQQRHITLAPADLLQQWPGSLGVDVSILAQLREGLGARERGMLQEHAPHVGVHQAVVDNTPRLGRVHLHHIVLPLLGFIPEEWPFSDVNVHR
mmetsp:Transcript_153451/g.268320  ORF Transcript_153451/g.268320 Transcript_153451/m.268320 type:complete len:627 (-) Transcript_153451:486-2366(-)